MRRFLLVYRSIGTRTYKIMAYICGNSSSIYVSLFVSGPYTTVHIRQHLNAVDATTGNTQINRDGLFLTTDEFASLLFQLKAIEKSFAKEKGEEGEKAAGTKETVLHDTLSNVANVSLDVVDSSKRKASCLPQSSQPASNKIKKTSDLLKTWYANKIRGIIQSKLQDDCFSCLMELPDSYICQTHVNDSSHKYLEKYFSTVLDGIDKELAIKELKLSPAKSRSILSLTKKEPWRQAVQSLIQNETDQ